MATLTSEQTDFLKSHHIPLDKTFDASGLSSKDYKAKMKQNGTLVAYGVPPCPKGHTLKNKQANCIQCNPQAVSSLKRQAMSGLVYIAISPSQLLTKIDTTTESYTPDQYGARQIAYRMNQDKHAEIHDWDVVFIGRTDSIGEFENQIQQQIAIHQVAKKLTTTSKTTKASGIYEVIMDKVVDVFDKMPDFVNLHTYYRDETKIADFQQRYQANLAERQAQEERLANEQAEKQRTKLAEIERQKQAKLAQQKLANEQAKAKKLAQKRQRQQAIEQEKQAKLTQRQQQNVVTTSPMTPQPKANLTTTTTSSSTSDFTTLFKNRQMMIVTGVIMAIILVMVIIAIAQHTN